MVTSLLLTYVYAVGCAIIASGQDDEHHPMVRWVAIFGWPVLFPLALLLDRRR